MKQTRIYLNIVLIFLFTCLFLQGVPSHPEAAGRFRPQVRSEEDLARPQRGQRNL